MKNEVVAVILKKPLHPEYLAPKAQSVYIKL